MAQSTDVEQLMVELVNRARLDPAGEAARLGISLNEGLAPDTLSSVAKLALAPAGLLTDAARAHSQWMLATDTFSHTGIGGSDPGDRMAAAGYVFAGAWTWGENIAWQGTTGTASPASFIVDEHASLFLSPGHRENILNADFREIGIGAVSGQLTRNAQTYNALMTTQSFATSGDGVFVTGVAYSDRDGDAFYDIGEAHRSVAVNAVAGGRAGQDTTGTAGGYAVEVSTGLAIVTFSGGGLARSVSALVDASSGNAKVDLVNAQRLDSSVSMTLGDSATNGKLMGVAAISLTGNETANVLTGNKGANLLSGLGGNDRIDGSLGNDTLLGGFGADTLLGSSGNDALLGHGGNDSLHGGQGSDRLLGGVGNDTLTGGLGQDVFVLNQPLASASVDLITDFNPADDTIQLDDAAFQGLTPGLLAVSAFVTGTAATTPGERLLHDRAGGALYYDGDGNGAGARIQIAVLTPGLALTAADFVVI